MNSLMSIDATVVRQDEQGRYCLNDLHRASGSANRHRPSLWVANQQTQALLAEISKAGIPALTVVHGGNKQGTYVCRELVYSYAMWISAAFQLKVIRAYDALAMGSAQPDTRSATDHDLIAVLEARLAHALETQGLLKQLADVQARVIELTSQVTKPKRATARPITEEEIRMARAMKAQGVSTSAIARQLGRSNASISMLTRELH